MRCKGNNVSRRGFMPVGFLGGLGITLADFYRMKQAQADQKFYESKEGTAKSVIFIYFPGGMAHQESFDPKPYAPLEYRGPMNSIATKIPGYRIGETLKQTAQIADKITICNFFCNPDRFVRFTSYLLQNQTNIPHKTRK